MQALGVPYTDAERMAAVDDAKAQAGMIAKMITDQGGRAKTGNVKLEDSEMVAITAYLRRLGTDLFKAPPAAPAPAAATTVPVTEGAGR
jgi:cbb3-type cytochrome oxidase cytochrome c subunit